VEVYSGAKEAHLRNAQAQNGVKEAHPLSHEGSPSNHGAPSWATEANPRAMEPYSCEDSSQAMVTHPGAVKVHSGAIEHHLGSMEAHPGDMDNHLGPWRLILDPWRLTLGSWRLTLEPRRLTDGDMEAHWWSHGGSPGAAKAP
jgi:hypothetical protein